MVDAGPAVGGGRALVEDPLRGALAPAEALGEHVVVVASGRAPRARARRGRARARRGRRAPRDRTGGRASRPFRLDSTPRARCTGRCAGANAGRLLQSGARSPGEQSWPRPQHRKKSADASRRPRRPAAAKGTARVAAKKATAGQEGSGQEGGRREEGSGQEGRPGQEGAPVEEGGRPPRRLRRRRRPRPRRPLRSRRRRPAKKAAPGEEGRRAAKAEPVKKAPPQADHRHLPAVGLRGEAREARASRPKTLERLQASLLEERARHVHQADELAGRGRAARGRARGGRHPVRRGVGRGRHHQRRARARPAALGVGAADRRRDRPRARADRRTAPTACACPPAAASTSSASRRSRTPRPASTARRVPSDAASAHRSTAPPPRPDRATAARDRDRPRRRRPRPAHARPGPCASCADGPVPLVGDDVGFVLARNTGGAFSLFQAFTPVPRGRRHRAWRSSSCAPCAARATR